MHTQYYRRWYYKQQKNLNKIIFKQFLDMEIISALTKVVKEQEKRIQVLEKFIGEK